MQELQIGRVYRHFKGDYYLVEGLAHDSESGVPLKHIQEWLGHSDFTTTANIYAHLDYKSKITSAQAMETGLALPEGGDFGSRWREG